MAEFVPGRVHSAGSLVPLVDAEEPRGLGVRAGDREGEKEEVAEEDGWTVAARIEWASQEAGGGGGSGRRVSEQAQLPSQRFISTLRKALSADKKQTSARSAALPASSVAPSL